MGAIDHNPEAVEPQPLREALLDELNRPAADVVEPFRAAKLGRRRAASRDVFDDVLNLRFELVARRSE